MADGSIRRWSRRPGGVGCRHRRRSPHDTGVRLAFANPVRRIFYNLAVTSVSVAVALTIGTIELLQVGAGAFGLEGSFWGFIVSLDFNRIGYAVAALFILAWLGSAVLWKTARLERRWSASLD
jgi:high-affinity nickel-transport protein